MALWCTLLCFPAFYTSKYGYKMCLRIYLNGDGTGRGTHLSLFFVVMRGHSDALLKWPFNQKVSPIVHVYIVSLDIIINRRHCSKVCVLAVFSWVPSFSFFVWLLASIHSSSKSHGNSKNSIRTLLSVGHPDVAGSKQPRAHHRCFPTRHLLFLLPETCQWHEHCQRVPPLLPSL